MPKSDSGRLVIDIEPALKTRLYSALDQTGSTLKEWFLKSAEKFADEYSKAGVRREVSYRRAAKSAKSVVREELPMTGQKQADTGKFKLVSMFSGCGGMDLGFVGGFEFLGRRYKSLPFEILWANDLNREACKTYARNLGHPSRAGDAWELMDEMPSSADVLVGGFPCQDISVNGKRAGVNGARSGLYKAMVEAVRRIRPKVFVAENVKALLRQKEWIDQVVEDFEALGYRLSYQLYRAADYGVPQSRERVLIVGTAPGVRSFSPPAPERNASNWITAKEAIGDLENVAQSPHINHIWSLANKSPEQGNRRLTANRPGYTIRAECHGNIQFHYDLPRRISMREAARIQSFPDKFIFMSGLREIERQVGNAVPPVLAWHVANSVLECLR